MLSGDCLCLYSSRMTALLSCIESVVLQCSSDWCRCGAIELWSSIMKEGDGIGLSLWWLRWADTEIYCFIALDFT